MFFKKKRKLKQEYDEQLLAEIQDLKAKWMEAKNMHSGGSALHLSEQGIEEKIAKVKYFYLFKEARIRKVTARQ